MKGFLQFHLSVKFQASGNRIIPFASLNFWFDSFPLPKRKKPRVHQVDKMNRPTARNNYKRYSQEDSVDITSELLRDLRTIMKQIANKADQGNCVDGAYYISKTWLQQ
ncbi:hypothetical protein I3760_08G017900 [Carya illinoinensis]|nr:hypothetical protein I3760_08G017900 [Carya illinoinensis]